MDETPVKIGNSWYPRSYVSCPGCGAVYGHHNTGVCTTCEECSRCCREAKPCKARKIMKAAEFVEKMEN